MLNQSMFVKIVSLCFFLLAFYLNDGIAQDKLIKVKVENGKIVSFKNVSNETNPRNLSQKLSSSEVLSDKISLKDDSDCGNTLNENIKSYQTESKVSTHPNSLLADYDLYVYSVEVLDEAGPDITYKYTIGNNGTGSVSSGFKNSIYLSIDTNISNSDYFLKRWSAGSDVPAGGTYTSGSLVTYVSGVPNGSYYLGVITDATSMVTETNESNNTGYASSPMVSINSTYTSDLYVHNVEVIDAIGPEITYKYTIGNNGTIWVGAGFRNSIYLSLDTNISDSDYFIKRWRAGSDVPAGGTYTSGSLTTSISDVPNGNYYLGVITDATGLVTETNESNNTGYDSSPMVGIGTSGLDIADEKRPKNFLISQNYPNPFNPVTKIEFNLPSHERVVLKIYNSLGQEILTLLDKELNPGMYTLDFNGAELSSGVYYYIIHAGSYFETKKMTLIK